jgi:nitroreductase
MDTYRTILSKRDTRRFSPRPIEADVIDRILNAGRMAGSARAAEPFRLLVLQDPEVRRKAAACGQATGHVVTGTLVVAIVLLPEFGVAGAPFTLFRGPFDGGRCAQNMMLAAWEAGITSCPASLHDGEGARVALGLPEGHYVLNVIAFGYPAEETADPMTGTRPRRPKDEFVRWDRWE